MAANDKLQFGLIGSGGMGTGDARTEESLGAKLVAAADIYDGRLTRVKEVFGSDVFTTRDYREVLARPDVDFVIVATPDHWHAPITRDALAAGKDVYCQKPMIHKISEGKSVIDAEKKSGKILQVGSQYVSSQVYVKARDLLKSGAIGEVNMVEAWLDRNSAVGAWQYSIPPDATPENIDWDRFLGAAPKHAFEPIRLFRWRNYRDYGTGVAGDLFVHLLSGLHFAMGSNGPTRVYATGGLRHWNDGRDVPDVMLSLLDYPKTERHPEFTLVLRVNFASGEPQERFGIKFVGSEGTMTTGFTSVVVSKEPREVEPGHNIGTFPQKTQEAFLREYRKKYPERRPQADSMRPESDSRYNLPGNYSAHTDHHRNFQNAVRSRKPFIEDGTFGFRAAGPALLTNTSYFENRACKWDPVAMKEL